MSLTTSRSLLSSTISIIKRFFAPPAKAAPKVVKDKKTGPIVVKRATNNLSFVSVFKDSKPPVLLKDDEYPEWLWTIQNNLPTLDELLKLDFDKLDDENKKRLFKLQRRLKIKNSNKKSVL